MVMRSQEAPTQNQTEHLNCKALRHILHPGQEPARRILLRSRATATTTARGIAAISSPVSGPCPHGRAGSVAADIARGGACSISDRVPGGPAQDGRVRGLARVGARLNIGRSRGLSVASVEPR